MHVSPIISDTYEEGEDDSFAVDGRAHLALVEAAAGVGRAAVELDTGRQVPDKNKINK